MTGIYLDGWDEDTFNTSMWTNCIGPVTLTEQLLPLMKKNKFGRITFVSTGYGKLSHLSKNYQKLFPSNPGIILTVTLQLQFLGMNGFLVSNLIPKMI